MQTKQDFLCKYLNCNPKTTTTTRKPETSTQKPNLPFKAFSAFIVLIVVLILPITAFALYKLVKYCKVRREYENLTERTPIFRGDSETFENLSVSLELLN